LSKNKQETEKKEQKENETGGLSSFLFFKPKKAKKNAKKGK